MTHSEDTSGLQTNLLIFQRLHKAHSLWPDWLQQKLHLLPPEEYAAHQRTNGTCLCIWKNTDSWFSQVINKNHKKLAQGWPECWKPTYPYSGEALSKMNLGVTALKTYILSTWKDSCKKTIKNARLKEKNTAQEPENQERAVCLSCATRAGRQLSGRGAASTSTALHSVSGTEIGKDCHKHSVVRTVVSLSAFEPQLCHFQALWSSFLVHRNRTKSSIPLTEKSMRQNQLNHGKP